MKIIKKKKCCIHNTLHNCLYCVQCVKYFIEECKIIYNEISFNHIFITRELTFCKNDQNIKIKNYVNYE